MNVTRRRAAVVVATVWVTRVRVVVVGGSWAGGSASRVRVVCSGAWIARSVACSAGQGDHGQ
jgi:hypothetical protein